jgi:hypothetical protein
LASPVAGRYTMFTLSFGATDPSFAMTSPLF